MLQKRFTFEFFKLQAFSIAAFAAKIVAMIEISPAELSAGHNALKL